MLNHSPTNLYFTAIKGIIRIVNRGIWPSLTVIKTQNETDQLCFGTPTDSPRRLFSVTKEEIL